MVKPSSSFVIFHRVGSTFLNGIRDIIHGDGFVCMCTDKSYRYKLLLRFQQCLTRGQKTFDLVRMVV